MFAKWFCVAEVERQTISRLIEDKRAVTAIEYALIAALIAVAAIAAFTLVGNNLSTTLVMWRASYRPRPFRHHRQPHCSPSRLFSDVSRPPAKPKSIG